MKSSSWRLGVMGAFAAAMVLAASACVPNTTVFQSGRTLQKGEYEVTAYGSTHTYRAEDEFGNGFEVDQTNFGLQGGLGLNEKADLRLQYSFSNSNNLRGHSFELGPKLSLLPEQLSVYLPLQMTVINDDNGNRAAGFDDTAVLVPTLLASFEVIDQILEINPGVRLWMPIYRDVLENGYDFAFTFVIGVGASTNLSLFVIRPEINVTFFRIDGESFSTQTTFGLGISLESGLFQKR